MGWSWAILIHTRTCYLAFVVIIPIYVKLLWINAARGGGTALSKGNTVNCQVFYLQQQPKILPLYVGVVFHEHYWSCFPEILSIWPTHDYYVCILSISSSEGHRSHIKVCELQLLSETCLMPIPTVNDPVTF